MAEQPMDSDLPLPQGMRLVGSAPSVLNRSETFRRSVTFESREDPGYLFIGRAPSSHTVLRNMQVLRHLVESPAAQTVGGPQPYWKASPDGLWCVRERGRRSLADVANSSDWKSVLTEVRIPALLRVTAGLSLLHSRDSYHGAVQSERVVEFGPGVWELADPELHTIARRARPLERGKDVQRLAQLWVRIMSLHRTPGGPVTPRVVQRVLGSRRCLAVEDVVAWALVMRERRPAALEVAVDVLYEAFEGFADTTASQVQARRLRAEMYREGALTSAALALDLVRSRFSSSELAASAMDDMQLTYRRLRTSVPTSSSPPLANMDQQRSLGLDAEWQSMLTDQSRVRSSVRKSQRKSNETSGRDQNRDRIFREDSEDTRDHLLRGDFVDAADLVDFHRWTDPMTPYWLARAGVLVAVRDHGRLLLPTFQFDAHWLPLANVINIARFTGVNGPSWSSLSWWTEPQDLGDDLASIVPSELCQQPASELRRIWPGALV